MICCPTSEKILFNRRMREIPPKKTRAVGVVQRFEVEFLRDELWDSYLMEFFSND